MLVDVDVDVCHVFQVQKGDCRGSTSHRDVMAKWSAMFCERQVKQLDITEPEINNLIQFCLKGYQCVSWLHLSLLCIISMSDTVLFFGGMNVHMEWNVPIV